MGTINQIGLRRKAMFFKGVSGGGSSAQPYIDAVGTFSTVQEDAIKVAVAGFESSGSWDEYKVIQLFINGTLLNLKDPVDADANFRGVLNGTTTYSQQGLKTDGSTGYLETYYTPSIDSVLNDEHYIVSCNSNYSNVNKRDFGAYNNDAQMTEMVLSGGAAGETLSATMNTSVSALSTTQTDARGVYSMSKNVSTDLRLFKNGVLKGNGVSEGILPTRTIWLGGLNTGGLFAPSKQNYTFFGISSGLTDAQIIADHATVNTLQAALYRNYDRAELYPEFTPASITEEGIEMAQWSANPTYASVVSSIAESNSGTRSVEVTANATNYGYGEFQLTCEVGSTIDVSFYAKAVPIGTKSVQVRIFEDTTLIKTWTDSEISTNWEATPLTHSYTATSNIQNFYFSASNGGSATIGDKLYIDDISITETKV